MHLTLQLSLINRIASDPVIYQAYDWLCEKRKQYHHNNDVWHVRFGWAKQKAALQKQLRSGRYRLNECHVARGAGRPSELWSAMDALVLKAIAIVLTEHLKPHLSDRCFHLAGTGGLKGAVREVATQVSEHRFVFRTDVKGYYASIDHDLLFELIRQQVKDARVLALLWQYLKRIVSDGGDYRNIERGISLSCPLSPLMGALYLKLLDDQMAMMGCCYVRYMDDWVVLTPTRWKLRAAIRAVNQVMAKLRVQQHPDKTSIGRIQRGFDFLGYRFSTTGLTVARQTVERCAARISRLYEQGAAVSCIGDYVRRWRSWVKAGLGGKPVAMGFVVCGMAVRLMFVLGW